MYSGKLPEEKCSEFTTDLNIACSAVDKGAASTGSNFEDEAGYENIRSLVTRATVLTPDTKQQFQTKDNI